MDKVKNYDDLIFRRNLQWNAKKKSTPLMLVLLVLPEDEKEWIQMIDNKEKTVLGGALYWFYPGDDLDFTVNKKMQGIRIPLKNKFDLDFFRDIFNLPFIQ